MIVIHYSKLSNCLYVRHTICYIVLQVSFFYYRNERYCLETSLEAYQKYKVEIAYNNDKGDGEFGIKEITTDEYGRIAEVFNLFLTRVLFGICKPMGDDSPLVYLRKYKCHGLETLYTCST